MGWNPIKNLDILFRTNFYKLKDITFDFENEEERSLLMKKLREKFKNLEWEEEEEENNENNSS